MEIRRVVERRRDGCADLAAAERDGGDRAQTGLGYTFEYDSVSLGPCSFMGIDNLYITTSQRMNPPAGVTGLGSTPALNPETSWSRGGCGTGWLERQLRR